MIERPFIATYHVDPSLRDRAKIINHLEHTKRVVLAIASMIEAGTFTFPPPLFSQDQFPFGRTSPCFWNYDSHNLHLASAFLYLRSQGQLHPNDEEGFLPRPSLSQMPSNTTLFLGGLEDRVSIDDLVWMCRFFGDVEPNVKMADSGSHSFVTFTEKTASKACLSHLQGFKFKGISVRVNHAMGKDGRYFAQSTQIPPSIAAAPVAAMKGGWYISAPLFNITASQTQQQLQVDIMGSTSYQKPRLQEPEKPKVEPVAEETWVYEGPYVDCDGLLGMGNTHLESVRYNVMDDLCPWDDPVFSFASTSKRPNFGPIGGPVRFTVQHKPVPKRLSNEY
ncbi:hypothetical protein IAT40_001309 [Kwoniella sp. CBS 6097]